MAEPERKATLNYLELLRYPILVLTILLGMWIARPLLGVDYTRLTKVGPSGLEFSEAKTAFVDLDSALRGMQKEIELLKASAPAAGEQASPEKKAEIIEAAQTVSNETAELADIGNIPSNKSEGKYIWMGNFNGNWERVQLNDPANNSPVSKPPDQLKPGDVFRVRGNMVVRAGLPQNNQEYYRGRESLGIVPRGKSVRLLSQPEPIERGATTQYWVRVEVL